MVMWFSVVFEVPQVFIPFICWCFTIISFSFQTPGLWQEELTKPLKTVCFLRSSIASGSFLYESGEWIFFTGKTNMGFLIDLRLKELRKEIGRMLN